MNMNDRDLERLSKAELIKMVEKLQNKARKPNIAIVFDDKEQVSKPQEPTKYIRSRDPKTGRFIKIHPDKPKPPKQLALPRLRDAKG